MSGLRTQPHDDLIRRLDESAGFLREKFGRPAMPETLVVLGSGFKGFESKLAGVRALKLADIPHCAAPTVEGHGADIVVGTAPNGREVAVMTGRIHLYEGHPAAAVVFPIRVLWRAGVKNVLLTNAAGSVDRKVPPGSIVLVSDHINFTGVSCLTGTATRGLGKQFVDMVGCYDPAWRERIRAFGQTVDGVYAGLLGPTYETPAETAMLGRLGAQVVGMSTVQEVIAARHLGLKVACLSFVSNMAGGLADAVDHGEVLSRGREFEKKLHDLLLQAIEVAPK